MKLKPQHLERHHLMALSLAAGSDPAWPVRTLAVSARRLHDVDRTGWWALLILPGIIWGFARGTVGTNRFGADPLEGKV